MTIFNTIILIITAIETIYIGKSIVKDLNKVLKYYKLTRKFQAIALSVNKAKVLAEQGERNACLQELDSACIQITRAANSYTKLLTEERGK